MIYENIELIFLKMAVRAIWYWQEGCWNRLAQMSYFEQLDRFLENGNGLYDVDDFDEPEITEKGRWVEPIRHLFKRPFEVDFNIWDWGYCAYEEDNLSAGKRQSCLQCLLQPTQTRLGAFGPRADPTRSKAAYPPPRLRAYIIDL